MRPWSFSALALLAAAACGTAASHDPNFAPEPGGRSGPTAAAAQDSESGAFVVTIGSDTLSVERYTRTADRITGEVVARSPRTAVRSYTLMLRPDGSVSRLEMTSRAPSSTTTAPPAVITMDLTADSAFTRFQRGDSVATFRVAAPRGLPLVNNSYAIYEQAMMQMRAAGASETQLTLVPPGSAQTFAVTLRAMGADSVLLTNIAGQQRIATDARGLLLGLDGMSSTQKFIVTRVASVDLQGMASEFAARDAAGRGVGPLSPRDSAVADVGGAHVAVDYGRPFKRGRAVMGQVVPFGEVWRTGANAATGLRTDRDLEIGGVTVPAGAYTLYTLPGRDGWKLIVNRQTGQWGTEYDAGQDLARIDMRVRPVSPAVEQFTIRLEPTGATGGVLRLSWDDTEAYVPFTVK